MAQTAPKTRSTAEKVLVRGFLVLGLGLIAFEARAKFGYDKALGYLAEKTATEELRVREVTASTKDEKKGEGKLTQAAMEQDDTPTWGTIRSEGLGGGVLASVLVPATGEPVFFKPKAVRNEKGENMLKDKDGNPIELQNEKVYERSLRWHSLRDLWEPRPVYKLTLKLSGKGDDVDEIVGFRTALEDPEPEETAHKFIPQSEAEKMLGGGGGGAPPPGAGGGGRPARPDEDNDSKSGKTDDQGDAKTEEAKSDDGKTEEAKSDGKTEEAKSDGKTEEAKSDDGKTKEAKSDDGKTKEAKSDDGKTEEAKSDG